MKKVVRMGIKEKSLLLILPLVSFLGLSQDLELDVHVLPTSIIGDQTVFNVSVRNTGEEDAQGVEVQVELESGLRFRNFNPNTLDFDSETGIWRLGTIGQKRSKVLTLMATYAQKDNALLSAEITKMTGIDPDSTPGNGVDTNGNGKIINDKGDEDDGDAAQNGPFN